MSSIAVPAKNTHWIRRLLAFAGPGYMVAVGYMDPGNWATDLQGGAAFGYKLLSVIVFSSLIAMLLQALSARLGIVTGRDLAQMCRTHFPRAITIPLWIGCELAIIACDLAEVIGTAIALKLLFGLSILTGSIISIGDALLILLLMQRGFRYLEAFVIALLSIIAICFGIQIIAASPPAHAVFSGFLPSLDIITNSNLLYIAIGIIGATVMPHNLYLHSSIVQTRDFTPTPAGKRDALRWSGWDSCIALTLALFVNAAILIVAAAAFHTPAHHNVADIEEAYHLLSPLLGLGVASTLFAVALLAAGTNSTLTGTLAGQIVMEGFLKLRLPHWARRLLTRLLAVLPVIIATAFYGEKSVGDLLIFSQIILSLQLPFAIIPLVMFVSNPKIMGDFCVSRSTKIISWLIAIVITLLNIDLIIEFI